ncbi:MAG: hypothetical protein UT33_C0005G0120 [Candidatus Peregrinibacteria bacterium GW2011_GWC2_39_14]|nr:MAG: hypothetical protein US92_C0001G0120 [Candidatus Peregrinibacteria bacterium GW2011_GWA2_38_36]KKR07176.1 MAG: hypothetical protein UT33_C0005G0120 [Candidatus Peregrinibacteria bacterium GW2011_GWC2_39_14]
MLVNFLNQDWCKPARLIYMGAEGSSPETPNRQDSQDDKKEARDIVEKLDGDMSKEGKALTRDDIDKKYNEAKAKLDDKVKDLSAKGYLDQTSADNMAFVEEQMKVLDAVKNSYVALLDGLDKEKEGKKEEAKTAAKTELEQMVVEDDGESERDNGTISAEKLANGPAVMDKHYKAMDEAISNLEKNLNENKNAPENVIKFIYDDAKAFMDKEVVTTDADAKAHGISETMTIAMISQRVDNLRSVMDEFIKNAPKNKAENAENKRLAGIEEALDSGKFNTGIIPDSPDGIGTAYKKINGVMYSKNADGEEYKYTKDTAGKYTAVKIPGTAQGLEDELFNNGTPSISVDPNAGKGVEAGTAKATEKVEINKDQIRKDLAEAAKKDGFDEADNDFYKYDESSGEIEFKGADGKNQASLRLQDVCAIVCPEAMQDGKVLTVTKKQGGKQIDATWDAGKKDFVDGAGKHVPIVSGDKFKVKEGEKRPAREIDNRDAGSKLREPEKVAEKEPTNEEILQKAATETAQDWLERKIQGEVKNEDSDAEHLFVDDAVEAAEKGNNASNDLVERVQENMKKAIEKATGVKVAEEEYSEEKAKDHLSQIKEVTLHGVKYDINLSDKKSVESVVSAHINIMKGGVKIENGEKKREGKEGLLSALKDVSARFEDQMKPGNFEKYFEEQKGRTSALEAAVKAKIEGEMKGIASQTEAVEKNYLKPEDMAKTIAYYDQTDKYVDLKIKEFVKNAMYEAKLKADIEEGNSEGENIKNHINAANKATDNLLENLSSKLIKERGVDKNVVDSAIREFMKNNELQVKEGESADGRKYAMAVMTKEQEGKFNAILDEKIKQADGEKTADVKKPAADAPKDAAGDNELSDETAGFMEEKLTKGEVKLVNEMEKKIPLTIQGPDVKDAGNMNTTMDEAQKGARQKFANEMAKNIGLSTPDADINDLSLETNGEFKNPSENKIRYDITIKNPRAFAKQYLFNSQKIGPKARKK